MKLYPAIDLIEGRCVRLFQGNFELKTEYAADPVEVAKGFASSGAEFLHIVDLDGARSGERRQTSLIGRIAKESGLQVQTGGGIRTLEDVQALVDFGMDRVVLGSLAVKSPDITKSIIVAVGADKVTLGLDVRLDESGTPRAATHGWQSTENQSLWEILNIYKEWEDLQILCTDISTDGTLSGPNFVLYDEIRRQHPTLTVLASGGIGSLADIRLLHAQGIGGAVIGKALYEGKFTLAEALTC